MMVRYGADVELNTNLLLLPEVAAEELASKQRFQNNMLQRRLCALGYEEALNSGTDLISGLVANNPAAARLSGKALALERSKLYVESCFGALSKNRRGLSVLLCNVARAKPQTASDYNVCITPAGIEYGVYHKADFATFALSGIKVGDNSNMTMEQIPSFVEPATGIRCMLSRPFANFEQGMYHVACEIPRCTSRSLSSFRNALPNGRGLRIVARRGVHADPRYLRCGLAACWYPCRELRMRLQHSIVDTAPYWKLDCLLPC